MKIKYQYIINSIFLLFILFSCKKDKLEGDKSILEGKWKWEYSIRAIDNPDDPDYPTVKYSSINSVDSYYLEFDRKGYLELLKMNEKEKCYRLVFINFKDSDWFGYWSAGFRFDALLNNKKDLPFYGYVTQDSLRTNFSNAPVKKMPGDLGIEHYYSRCP